MDGFLHIFHRRRFNASKFKSIAKLAISRAAILKNHSQVRYSNAKSDIIQLLNLGNQQRALLRVEHMMKEQNMIDVFVMIEQYCYFLIDRIIMLKKDRECDDEIKEAISSLIFASSRCGEFPELQKIRGIFESRFGQELTVELRNNSGVNPKMIQKLSTQRPSLECRMKVLKNLASENGIVLDLVEDAPVLAEEKLDESQKQKQLETYTSTVKHHNEVSPNKDQLYPEEKISESVKARKEYRNAADAAFEAFEAAAYAAVAARAAVELSRPKSFGSYGNA
ncbi:Regulator of Vps4 activity in the MVB pathway protein [Euphorbia peplus]|nr:Regulator of Vps4 activity in the MVB pathway protein [Euphorbia peplus]